MIIHSGSVVFVLYTLHKLRFQQNKRKHFSQKRDIMQPVTSNPSCSVLQLQQSDQQQHLVLLSRCSWARKTVHLPTKKANLNFGFKIYYKYNKNTFTQPDVTTNHKRLKVNICQVMWGFPIFFSNTFQTEHNQLYKTHHYYRANHLSPPFQPKDNVARNVNLKLFLSWQYPSRQRITVAIVWMNGLHCVPAFLEDEGCHLSVLAGGPETDLGHLQWTKDKAVQSKSRGAAFMEWQQGWTAEWHHCFSTTHQRGKSGAAQYTVAYILYWGQEKCKGGTISALPLKCAASRAKRSRVKPKAVAVIYCTFLYRYSIIQSH